MAELKLTRAQQAVVSDRGGQLLVSAAAGSGKTKVLVDRLLGMVADRTASCNLDEFLIITYTKAAAAELRTKIAAALSDRLAREPGNLHLLRQMNRLYSAKISTIHAFCADLLRTHAAEAGVDPEFRVAEETECALLRARVLSRVLEEAYAQLTPGSGFQQLADTLGYGRSDRTLEQIVLETYDNTQCHADPDGWIAACRETLFGAYADASETPWGAYLMDAARRGAALELPTLRSALEEASLDEKLNKAYVPALNSLLSVLERMARAASWDELSQLRAVEHPPFRAVRGYEDKEYLEQLKALRDRIRDMSERLLAPFYAPSEEVLDDLAVSAVQLDALLMLVSDFSKAYAQEKRRRRIADFSDLEHQALRLLRHAQTAREVSAQFCEVMVDEYQDTNAVQDAIFRAVSGNGAHLFMVGDVKQSIYRFRLADPSLFLAKYRAFPDAEVAAPEEPRKILLTQNFRSRPEILAAANHVFRTVMSEQVGDLAYTDAEALEPGASFAPLDQPLVELHCIPTLRDDDSPGKTAQEAAFVAARIARLLQEKAPISDGAGGVRPVRAGDIVILMRSPRSAAGEYQRALSARGIRAQTDQGGDLLQSAEVQMLLAMLQLVDNPHQDIPLLAVLGGPIFAFPTDLLVELRTADRKSDVYTALSRYQGDDPAPAGFLSRLNALRAQADYLSLDELISTVIREFGFQEIYGAMAGGAQRRANLLAFTEYAASYSSGTYRLLMDFLRHIAGLQEQGRTISTAADAAGDAVRILSIHKSKGLEFPVVFLCDLSRKFNFTDLTRPVLLDPVLGAGADAVDTELLIRYPTLAKQAIAAKKRAETVSEELRVLYVAMTRPKDMLIMTYCSKFLKTELIRLARASRYPASPAQAAEARCPGAWILMAALCRPEAGELFDLAGRPACAAARDSFSWEIRLHSAETQESAVEVQPQREKLVQPNKIMLDERAFGYVYPHLSALRIPAKLTATQMKGRSLDAEAAELAPAVRVSSFAPPKGRLSAAERGSATHLAMQYLDLERCMVTGVSAELARLSAEGFLTAEQASAVRADELERLLHSDFGARIRRSTLAREMKFSILLDADRCIEGAPAGEKIMVQGVADCILRENGGLTVIDYKTDRIRPGGEQERAARYLAQMRTYCVAVEELYGERPRSCLLYFFATGQTVELIEQI